MNVYNEKGKYTEQALILKEETSAALHELVDRYISSGFGIEAIEYIMHEAIHMDLIKAKYMYKKSTKNFTSDLDGQ